MEKQIDLKCAYLFHYCCNFILGTYWRTQYILLLKGIRNLQNFVLLRLHLKSLSHWLDPCVNPASLVCSSSLPVVDKRSTSTTNLKQPSEAGISKRLSSSSATLIRTPDKRKSPLLPPLFLLPPSYQPCIWVLLFIPHSIQQACTNMFVIKLSLLALSLKWTLTPDVCRIQCLVHRFMGKQTSDFLARRTSQLIYLFFFCIHIFLFRYWTQPICGA